MRPLVLAVVVLLLSACKPSPVPDPVPEQVVPASVKFSCGGQHG